MRYAVSGGHPAGVGFIEVDGYVRGVNTTGSISAPVVFGDPFDFLLVVPEDRFFFVNPPDLTEQLGGASVRLTSFRVLDQQGNPLGGFQFGSQSNTVYPFEGGTFVRNAVIPEPSSVVLLLIGTLALAVAGYALNPSELPLGNRNRP